jgi:hypothetical protein
MLGEVAFEPSCHAFVAAATDGLGVGRQPVGLRGEKFKFVGEFVAKTYKDLITCTGTVRSAERPWSGPSTRGSSATAGSYGSKASDVDLVLWKAFRGPHGGSLVPGCSALSIELKAPHFDKRGSPLPVTWDKHKFQVFAQGDCCTALTDTIYSVLINMTSIIFVVGTRASDDDLTITYQVPA